MARGRKYKPSYAEPVTTYSTYPPYIRDSLSPELISPSEALDHEEHAVRIEYDEDAQANSCSPVARSVALECQPCEQIIYSPRSASPLSNESVARSVSNEMFDAVSSHDLDTVPMSRVTSPGIYEPHSPQSSRARAISSVRSHSRAGSVVDAQKYDDEVSSSPRHFPGRRTAGMAPSENLPASIAESFERNIISESISLPHIQDLRLSDEGEIFSTYSRNQYWFSDGSIIVKAEDKLYNLHRSILERHSAWFKQRLSESSLTSKDEIVLENIKCEDFEVFLSFLYPSSYHSIERSVEEWKSILIVASHLQFESIRECAIQGLTSTASLIDRIVLGRSLDVEHWLMPAFTGLTEHPDPLTVEEGKVLGLETVIYVAAARERYLRHGRKTPFEFTKEMFGL